MHTLFVSHPFAEFSAVVHKDKWRLESPGVRVSLVAIFLAMIFPVGAPLYLAWIWDQAVLGGNVFASHGVLVPFLMTSCVGMFALLLWPLPVLATKPALWARQPWRGVIRTYAAVAACGTLLVAVWLFGRF